MTADNTIVTLSSNNPNEFNVIQGLLYVPELGSNSSCDKTTLDLVPANVTQAGIADVASHTPLVALAPWSTPACVQEYLMAMRADAVQGAIFFHNDNSSVQPPQPDNAQWNLGDGGHWKSQNQFPVYALPSILCIEMIKQLSYYSGNMSQAPYGNILTQRYNPNDPVRLYVRMDVSGSSDIPSLWVFLIIVLAVLLAVVLSTSVIMHMIQRRQRTILARRVANGEVDLEALGIKRLNVPQTVLDKMPQYTYAAKEGGTSDDVSSPIAVPEATATSSTKAQPITTTVTAQPSTRQSHYTQPTCPICLDDFVPATTTVRELPCHHIFHPECIDPFLRENSSLCPVCKQSALPAGFCPVNVTNIMVRRERLMRRMRERNAGPSREENNTEGVGGRIRRSLAGWSLAEQPLSAERAGVGPVPRRQSSIGVPRGEPQQTELSTMPSRTRSQVSNAASGALSEDVPADVAAQGTEARRNYLRERMARRQSAAYAEHAREAQEVDIGRPLCELLHAASDDETLLTDHREASSGTSVPESRLRWWPKRRATEQGLLKSLWVSFFLRRRILCC